MITRRNEPGGLVTGFRRLRYIPTAGITGLGAVGVHYTKKYFSGGDSAVSAAVKKADTIRKKYSLPAKSAKAVRKDKKIKKAATKKRKYDPAAKECYSKIRKIEKQLAGHTSTYTYCASNCSPITTSGVNLVKYSEWFMNNSSIITTALSAVPYYDPSTNTFVDKNIGALAQHTDFHLDTFGKLTFANNYTTPCIVSWYFFKAKSQTNVDVEQCIANWATDNLKAGAVTSPLFNVSYAKDAWKDMYNLESSGKRFLNAGQQKTIKYAIKDIAFDPAEYDDHVFEYTKMSKALTILLRVEGVPAHDGVPVCGLSDAGVDIIVKRKWVLKYDAGQDCNFYRFNNGLGAMAGTVYRSMAPVGDNTSYNAA